MGQVHSGGLRITHTRYAPNETQPWHSHENPNFHFLLAGQFIDESREQGEHAPEPFSLIFHPARVVHRGVTGPEGRRGLNIEFSREWLRTYGLPDRYLETRPSGHDTRLSLSLVAAALKSDSETVWSDIIFESLFVTLNDVRETPQWFRRLEARLSEDEDKSWRVVALAAEVGVHPVYLARVFRQHYGIALTTYLQQSRLLRAVRKLGTAENLTVVALDAGFSDHAHFSRSFKEWFGMTPSQARERLRQVASVQACAPPAHVTYRV